MKPRKSPYPVIPWNAPPTTMEYGFNPMGITKMSHILKPMADNLGIPMEDLSDIMREYFNNVYNACAFFKHPRIPIDGLGTLNFEEWKVHKVYKEIDAVNKFKNIYKQYELDEQKKQKVEKMKKSGQVAPITQKLRKLSQIKTNYRHK